VDLVPHDGGVCSDCHAGENAFVNHPFDPIFLSLRSRPSYPKNGWHVPMVDASWPQNPGPTTLLAGVSSEKRCDQCHRPGTDAGRLPEVSAALEGYCRCVLTRATEGGTRTMPPAEAPAPYDPHRLALQAACDEPGGGTVVDIEVTDDPSFVSPPRVHDPIYGCAEEVEVRGAVLDAEVLLFVDDPEQPFASRVARSPSGVTFEVPKLEPGQSIWAVQAVDGVRSEPSETVTVRDWRDDYDALPVPAIDPSLIHECANTIAVRHINGARLLIETIDIGERTQIGAARGYTVGLPLGAPFSLGDAFRVRAQLCEDTSAHSITEEAVAEPTSIPAPVAIPRKPIDGQQLIDIERLTNGAHTDLFGPDGQFGSLSWPISWYDDYDVATAQGRPLADGESVLLQTRLCGSAPAIEWQSPPAEGCSALDAPRIRAPRVGDSRVVVEEAVPGARIRVLDPSSSEIGDGAGDFVNLARAVVAGESIVAVQEVGSCTSPGFRVRVLDAL